MVEGNHCRRICIPLLHLQHERFPATRLNQFRVFDFNDDDPQLDVAQLVIQHPVGESGRSGFRVNMIAGSGVPEITASYGIFRDTTTGVAHHFDIPNSISAMSRPSAKGSASTSASSPRHLGYEVIGGYDGYNDNFSRGFIFGYGVPFTHTGVKASYPSTAGSLQLCCSPTVATP